MLTYTLIVPLTPFNFASQGRYLTPFIKGIGSVVKYLRQKEFDLEQWQSILGDVAIDVL